MGAGGAARGGLAHSGWNTGFNGVHQGATTHTVSRPAFHQGGGLGGNGGMAGTMA